MEALELIARIGVALAIGLLIGMEREWRGPDTSEPESRTAGLRTFGLIGLLGGVWGAIVQIQEEFGLLGLSVAFAAFSAIFAFYRARELSEEHKFGATTTIAAMTAFALGALALLAPVQVAGAGGIAVTLLLVAKERLQDWLSSMSWVEFRAALILLVMSVVILPILPDRDMGPYAAINPFQLWLLTVVLAGVSFAGYVALKAAGSSAGAAISGLLGGLASSTAAVISLARFARNNREQRRQLAGGAALAGVTMIVRILLFVGVLNTALIAYIAMPLLAAAIVFAASGVWLIWRDRLENGEREEITLRNPFALLTILELGAVLAIVLVVSKIAVEIGGDEAAIAIGALSGLASVDAASLAFARFGETGLAPTAAAFAILAAAVSNTIVKAGLAWWAGGRYVGLMLLTIGLAGIVAGCATLLVTPILGL